MGRLERDVLFMANCSPFFVFLMLENLITEKYQGSLVAIAITVTTQLALRVDGQMIQ